jgi:tripartite ATP-independent transporter DctM subunit
MLITLLFLSLLVFIILGVPISFALLLSSFIYLLGSGLTLQIIPQIMVKTFESFVLLAIPFFMLAGQLMNLGGITDKILRFAQALTGHIRGGLGHVNVVASMIFAGMSGSAIADSSGIGEVEIKIMTKKGFDPEFSAAITAASSTIGPIIPPSIPMVIYGSIAGVSIGRLFIGGAIPGFIMGISLMITVYIISKRKNYPRHERASLVEFIRAFLGALLPLLTPGIILGGILLGVFTPTEAAVAAVTYAMFLGFFIYNKLSFTKVINVLLKVAKDSANIMLIISAASVFGWILAYESVPEMVMQGLFSITTNKYMILFIINIILLIAGCFMEGTALILLVTPVLLPILEAANINLVHFGVVMILNLMIGLITPPVGICLYIVSNIAKISVEKTIRSTVPFYIPLIITLFIVTFLPFLVTFLPSLLIE